MAQEAWLRAFQNLDQFEGRARFSTWLVRIAIYEALSRKRRTLRQAELVRAHAPLRPGADGEHTRDPESLVARRRLASAIESAIDELPQKLRLTYLLRDVEGCTTRAAAKALGVSTAVVKVRLHRARAALRRSLGASGAFDPSEAFPFGFERCDRLVARRTG